MYKPRVQLSHELLRPLWVSGAGFKILPNGAFLFLLSPVPWDGRAARETRDLDSEQQLSSGIRADELHDA